MEGKNGLTTADVDLFKRIVKNIFELLKLRESTRSQVKQFNKNTNYVRRKMRLHFASKAIIQPLDVVTIFIGSKSKIDDKISVGLQPNFTGLNFATTLNNTVRDIGHNWGDLKNFFSGSLNDNVEMEKASIVGADFPTWLWTLMRNDFTRQSAGICTFVGLVKGVVNDYRNGKYTLNVDMEDNAGYFKKGQININPSLDVYNSPLYDPLTPFKIDFDESNGFPTGKIPQLLDENIRLLDSGTLKFTSGKLRGQTASHKSYLNADFERSSNSFRRILNDVNGFVYRWKEGIGALTNFGEPSPLNQTSDASVKLTSNAFAGQDVMNVLSLLITGQPYNFNTFMKASIDSGNLSSSDLTNENMTKSFFKGLLNDISNNNQIWGNFLPFKKLIINEAAYSFLTSGQIVFTQQNAQINDLLSQRAQLFDQLSQVNSSFAKNPMIININDNFDVSFVSSGVSQNASQTDLISRIGALDIQIESAKRSFTKDLNKVNLNNTSGGIIKIFGDDISFNDTSIYGNTSLNEEGRIAERENLRRKVNFLTQRRLWKVKANEDPNLFIVDDSYDKDYDIQAFEKSLAGKFETFNSDFQDIDGEITSVLGMGLGLEVFADTQGHIQARPPQYNKVPSSVFFKMFRDKYKTGVQVFPSFLERLFANQIDNFATRLEIIEDQIRLRAMVLGRGVNGSLLSSDEDIQSFISGAGGQEQFVFATDVSTGKLGSKDLRIFLQQKNPDLIEAGSNGPLKELSSRVSYALSASRNFDIIRRADFVNQADFILNFPTGSEDRILFIRQRLEQKTGQPSPTIRDLLSNDRSLQSGRRSQQDVLKITNEISQYISERQRILQTLSNSIKNLDQGVTLNSSDTSGPTTALFPFLNGKQAIPDILQHMIEDESVDDLGPGSGSRYIIKDHQIIGLRIEEQPPPYTLVQVNGLFAEKLASAPSDLGIGSGGNSISTAFAVDYDMWRMYGFKAASSVNAPFLSDPVTQCAPYAVYLLNLARKNIFQASLDIIGNEYMQVGEVIYIESKNLLFYVEEVNQNFSYGSSFTTSLKLTYGHTPGEYIPTILDIVGKSLYNNKYLSSEYRNARFEDNANGETSLNAIGFDNRNVFTGAIADLVVGPVGEANRKVLSNILIAAAGIFNPQNLDKIPTIEIRTYKNDNLGISENKQLTTLASAIKQWLINPTKGALFNDKTSLVPDQIPSSICISENNVDISLVDLGKNTTEAPSKAAMNVARFISSNNSQVQSDLVNLNDLNSPEVSVLFSSVIDIWLKFKDSTESVATQPAGVTTDSQYQKKALAQLDDLLSKRKTF